MCLQETHITDISKVSFKGYTPYHRLDNSHDRASGGSSLLIRSKIEKVQRGIRGEKSSKDMASSRNLVSTIGALASPKMGDGTRCPEG